VITGYCRSEDAGLWALAGRSDVMVIGFVKKLEKERSFPDGNGCWVRGFDEFVGRCHEDAVIFLFPLINIFIL
jgi:hypothetical protein